MKINKVPLLIALFFGLLSISAVIPQESYAATSATATCERRVKTINNRGKKMAKKSKTIQANYVKANKGWKEKISVNKKFGAKYAGEARLSGQVTTLNKQIKVFQQGVKDYNAAKKPYIAERNAQVKSYKQFKAKCSENSGREAARAKIKALNQTDSKVLNEKSKAVSTVYKTKVRTGILSMREARTSLLSAKKKISRVNIASQSSIDSSVSEDDLDIDDDADSDFDESEMDDLSNILEEV